MNVRESVCACARVRLFPLFCKYFRRLAIPILWPKSVTDFFFFFFSYRRLHVLLFDVPPSPNPPFFCVLFAIFLRLGTLTLRDSKIQHQAHVIASLIAAPLSCDCQAYKLKSKPTPAPRRLGGDVVVKRTIATWSQVTVTYSPTLRLLSGQFQSSKQFSWTGCWRTFGDICPVKKRL